MPSGQLRWTPKLSDERGGCARGCTNIAEASQLLVASVGLRGGNHQALQSCSAVQAFRMKVCRVLRNWHTFHVQGLPLAAN